ncbi:MAG: hypothetical protein H6997_03655 [Moraxellaceae bacterium]|nr:hypothetical protein [Moraxellaceae bacterium]
MTTFDIRPATAADNHAILGLIGQPQPSNGVNFAFERLPDYFTSAQISHQQPHTLVVERRDNKEVVAMVNMGFREVFVDGQPKQIRYGSDLRIAPEYQGSRVLIYINRAVKDCVQNDWYQSVILEENDKSRSALEGGRAGLPIYRSLGTISTHTITGRKALFTPHKQIRRAQIADIPAMNAFIKQMAEHYQFLPRYDFYQLTHHHPYFNGLNIDDFLVLFDDEQLVGLVGLWNQKNFKQTRVVDYNRTVAMFRPIYNWWSRLTGGFVLPAKGQLVDYIALHSPLTHPKDSDSFRHLLHHAWLEVRQQQKAAMTLTLADTDPRLSVLADFKTIPLTAYQYAVAFKEPLLPILDNQRIPYFESGRL